MTVHDRLVQRAESEPKAIEAAAFLSLYLPLDRAVVLTDEMVDAALAKDGALLLGLLAPEVEPDDFELEAIRSYFDGPASDREPVPSDIP